MFPKITKYTMIGRREEIQGLIGLILSAINPRKDLIWQHFLPFYSELKGNKPQHGPLRCMNSNKSPSRNIYLSRQGSRQNPKSPEFQKEFQKELLHRLHFSGHEEDMAKICMQACFTFFLKYIKTHLWLATQIKIVFILYILTHTV